MSDGFPDNEGLAVRHCREGTDGPKANQLLHVGV